MNKNIRDNLNWQEFLSRSDMLWTKMPVCKSFGDKIFKGTPMTAGFLEHLNEPDARALTQDYTAFDSAPFLGNGTLGMMLWENAKGARFEINRSDVYDMREGCAVLYGRNRILNGYYQLLYKGKPTNKCSLRLDLWNAQLKGEIFTSVGGFYISAYVHALQNLIVLCIEPFGGEEVKLEFIPMPSTAVRPILRGEKVDGWGEYPPALQSTSGNVNMSVQRLTNMRDGKPNERIENEGCFANAWAKQEDSSTFFITSAFNNPDASHITQAQAESGIILAQQTGEALLAEQHREWWHTAYKKSFVSLPDARLESFYNIQLYKALSAAREGSAAIDNFGPWFKPSGWSALWANLNVQMAYSAFAFAGHADILKSFAHFLNKEQLEKCAKSDLLESYKVGSMALPCVMPSVKIEGEVIPPKGESEVRTTLGNLPYCLVYLWDAYAVTMNDEFLKETLFPLLKGALLYYECYLYEGSDKKLHLPYSWSPEWAVNTKDTSFELALLRWVCQKLEYTANRLEIKDDAVQRASEISKNLTDYPSDDKQGLYIGENAPYNVSHRHWSHMFSIYPTRLIQYTTQQNRRLIDLSMRQYMSLPSAYTGFSWVAIASLYAVCKNGNAARDSLHKLLNAEYLHPNTMYTEMEELEWPTLETPISVARSI